MNHDMFQVALWTSMDPPSLNDKQEKYCRDHDLDFDLDKDDWETRTSEEFIDMLWYTDSLEETPWTILQYDEGEPEFITIEAEYNLEYLLLRDRLYTNDEWMIQYPVGKNEEQYMTVFGISYDPKNGQEWY